jgi:hypothetical protein
MDLSATTGKSISGNNENVTAGSKYRNSHNASNCYQLLLQEDTKLWYLSALGIFEMLEEEKEIDLFIKTRK